MHYTIKRTETQAPLLTYRREAIACVCNIAGDLLAGIFSSDAEVIAAAADYLRAYAIDCLFTSIFFCYTGYYNGIGQTRFVMLQGIAGAFGVRVPVSYLISRTANATLFHIGLAMPLSSIVQLLLCLGFMVYLKRKKPEQTVQ